MQFCVITPTSGLDQFATKSKWHMVLAQQFVKDDAYAEFYLNRKAADDFIFLDNGAYENNYDANHFLYTIEQLQPDVAVLPDIINGGMTSTLRSIAFFHATANEFPKVRWMFIPQGKPDDLPAWFESLDKLQSLPMMWIGLTRFLYTHVVPNDPTVRVKLARTVRECYPGYPIHAMGMADGDLNEVKLLARQNIVTSIDSSAPVWRGWSSNSLHENDRRMWRREGREVDFSAPLPLNLTTINYNLESVLNACDNIQSGTGS